VKDGFISIPRRTVAALERQEIDRVGKEMAVERGLTYKPVWARRVCLRPAGGRRQSRQRALRHA